ncbi:MAG: hypothetical protein PHO56_03420 [Patescibacteria group bacterium]|nr:hypothetical protein [Patescibacteria group bacterium]
MENSALVDRGMIIQEKPEQKKVFFKVLMDFIFFVQAKIIQLLTVIFGSKEIDVAFISEIRYFKPGDEKNDSRLFGFNFKKFRVLDWIQYRLTTASADIRGQLFMIGMKSDEISRNPKKARELFLEAADRAKKKGAKIILLAANTKSIFGRPDTAIKRLGDLRPDITFTLGDNLTAGFINEAIETLFRKSGLKPDSANILIVAPRGLLGTSSASFIKDDLRCKNVWGMFNPGDGMENAVKVGGNMNISPVISFDDLPRPIDLVVTCGAQSYYELTAEVIEKIRRKNGKLIIVDPCEPANVREATLEKCAENAIYWKAGNGYNPNLKYVLGSYAARILGMKADLFWGCFSETFALAFAFTRHSSLKTNDWFSVDRKKIEFTRVWSRVLGFSLPPSSNL